jgi:acetolactate synthase-1/2/3 large subunit
MNNFDRKKFKFDKSSIDNLKNVIDVDSEIVSNEDIQKENPDWELNLETNKDEQDEKISSNVKLKNLQFILNECYPNSFSGLNNPEVQKLMEKTNDGKSYFPSFNKKQKKDYIDVKPLEILIIDEKLKNIPDDLTSAEIKTRYKTRNQKLPEYIKLPKRTNKKHKEFVNDEFIKIPKPTGSYALIDTLCQNGVKTLFGYPGGAILPIYDELFYWENANLLRHYLVRHEQGAVHAADGYARSTNNVGVCFATSGPGATNLITGIATAYMDSIPLLAITGQVASHLIGTDAFQEVDIFGVTLPIVKHSYIVKQVDDVNLIVSEAFYIAQNGRPGPVVVDIPKDMGTNILKREYTRFQPKQILEIFETRYNFELIHEDIHKALVVLANSQRPLLYVGGGAVTSGAASIIQDFVELFNLPITTTLMGKGIFNELEHLSLGMLGMHGTAYANFAVSNCDVLIAVGARFDDRVTGKLSKFACNAKIIHIDIDHAEMDKNKKIDFGFLGDVKTIMSALYAEGQKYIDFNLYSLQTKEWHEQITTWKKRYALPGKYNYQFSDESYENQSEMIVEDINLTEIKNEDEASSLMSIREQTNNENQQLTPQKIIELLGRFLPTAYYTTDVGQHQMWSAQYLNCLPNHWISSAGLGTMGFGVPAAIGVQIAHPLKTVVCISGDSSFQMNLQELGTIAQYNLPVKIIVINNHWQGMVRQWQQSFYGGRYSHSNMETGAPDLLKLAETYGIQGYRIDSLNEFELNFAKAIGHRGPTLIEICVVEDTNCYPMVKPGEHNAIMIGEDGRPILSPSLVDKMIKGISEKFGEELVKDFTEEELKELIIQIGEEEQLEISNMFQLNQAMQM